jgi:hypothetical protein
VPVLLGPGHVSHFEHDDIDVGFLGSAELAQVFEAVLFPDGLQLVEGGLELCEIRDALLDIM